MILCIEQLEQLDFPALMALYREGNEENGAYFYPSQPPREQLTLAERDFREYLQDDFFAGAGAQYWILSQAGVYLSALRLAPFRDGLLLEALETHPAHRRQGHAKALLTAVLQRLSPGTAVYSEVAKDNTASLRTHFACGFTVFSERSDFYDAPSDRYAALNIICP